MGPQIPGGASDESGFGLRPSKAVRDALRNAWSAGLRSWSRQVTTTQNV